MSRVVRRLVLGTVVAVMGALAVPLAAGSASATATSEVYARPSSGVFRLAGHGWGHGHGLSQWGADGAASAKGLTGAQIAAFYYPNTAQAVLSDRAIRVLLDCQPGFAACASASSTHPVWPAAELSATNGLVFVDRGVTGFTPLKLPTDRDRWRVKVDSAGYRLEGRIGTTWSAYPSASTVYKGPVDLSSATGAALPFVKVHYSATTGVVWREYRGSIRVVRSTTTTVRVVNMLGMESYLLGVVPRESPPSWPLHALFAQAIAARSYSAYSRAHVASTQVWDICDTTWCQVYMGAAQAKRSSDGTITRTALEPASTTKAVRCYATYYPKPSDPSATPDPCSAYSGPLIRTYSAQPIFAQFSSSNGGWSTATDSADADVQKYLIAQQDPYDGLAASSVHSWTADVSVSSLERAYTSVGRLTRLRITARDGHGDWGGRVQTAVLEGVNSAGAATSVTVSGSALKSAVGLKSNWFKPTTTTSPTPTPTATATPPPAPTVTGPATAARASQITITGTSAAGTTSVALMLRTQGATSWTKRSVAPGSDGHWSTTWTPTVDVSYYAVVGSQKSPTRTTTVSGTTITGPAQVTKGSTVSPHGWAAPGSDVTVCWRRLNAATCTARTVAVASTSSGYWASAKRLDVDYSYAAASAGTRSPTVTTHVV
ncbi:MAG: stage sporulation protein [Frankiales bacterium]|nr:stage sporulation protein [Frankiales bacterium]